MPTSPCPVYVFRSAGFAPSADTVVSVAPLDRVVEVYGSDGLASAFGGAAFFKNHESGACFAGVWGARNASRFRSELRVHMPIAVHKAAPDARLSYSLTKNERAKRPACK